MTEQWRPIPGQENRYEVSDWGRVRSLLPCRKLPVPHVLEGGLTDSGHRSIGLVKDGHLYTVLAHRLVALAFLGPCPPGLEVRHLDDNPTNNRLSNLRYGTRSENMLDRVRNGLHHCAAKRACAQGHPFDEESTRITRDGKRACRACARIRDSRRRATTQLKERNLL